MGRTSRLLNFLASMFTPQGMIVKAIIWRTPSNSITMRTQASTIARCRIWDRIHVFPTSLNRNLNLSTLYENLHPTTNASTNIYSACFSFRVQAARLAALDPSFQFSALNANHL
jgi:hypothetical protein